MITILQSAIPSKNAKVIRKLKGGRRYIAKNEDALTSTKSIMWQLADAENKREWARMRSMYLPLSHNRTPLHIQFKYFRPDHRRFDYLNAAAIVCDCLVKQKYIPDDSADVMLPVFVPYEIDARNPRVEITLL